MPLQHFNELLNPLHARRRRLGRLNSEKDGVPVLPVEGLKKSLRARVAIQCRLQITRHGRTAPGVVGCLPAASCWALSISASPAGFIWPPSISPSAFCRLIFDQMLFFALGVNF